MNNFLLNFHHLGLAVKNSGKSKIFLENMGYVCEEVVRDTLQNVNLVYCRHEIQPDIEIIFSTETPGPLEPILKDNNELIYHCCYSSPNLQQSINAIKVAGIKLLTISKPKPAILFDFALVSFYMASGFGLIEIVEENR
jgi:methylmalonyl-CoA/ethylmalonyl-CoA epimerase